jgi:hypothetical protein
MAKALKIVGTVIGVVTAVATFGASLAATSASGLFLGATAGTLKAVAMIGGVAPVAVPLAAFQLAKGPCP